MKNKRHYIERDIRPIIPAWLVARVRWQLDARSDICNEFAELLAKHAEFQRLHPET